MRLVFGLEELDRAFEKFPRNPALLICYGDVGLGMDIFCKRALLENLKAGRRAIYVATKESPLEVERVFLSLDSSFESLRRESRLLLVDMFSWMLGEEGLRKSRADFVIDDPRYFPKERIIFDRIFREIGEEFIVILDSLDSRIGMVDDPQDFLKHLMIALARIRARNSTMISCLTKGALDPLVERRLLSMADAILEFCWREDPATGALSRWVRMKSPWATTAYLRLY